MNALNKKLLGVPLFPATKQDWAEFYMVAVIAFTIALECRIFAITEKTEVAVWCEYGALALHFVTARLVSRIDRRLGIFGYSALAFTIFVLPIFFPVFQR